MEDLDDMQKIRSILDRTTKDVELPELEAIRIKLENKFPAEPIELNTKAEKVPIENENESDSDVEFIDEGMFYY